MIEAVDINYIAVLAGAVASMLIGWVWYTPSVFGKQWMAEVGKKMEDMKGTSGNKAMAGMFVGALIASYVMAHFVAYVGATTLGDGVQLGFWIWLGFVATVMSASVLFEGKSWKWFSITAGYQLVNFVVVAAILAMWS